MVRAFLARTTGKTNKNQSHAEGVRGGGLQLQASRPGKSSALAILLHVITQLSRIGEIRNAPAVEVVLGHALFRETSKSIGRT